jgi:hypothetical protein
LRTSADYAEYGTAVIPTISPANVVSTPVNAPRAGQSSFAAYKPFVFDATNWSIDQNDGTYAPSTTIPAAPVIVPNTTAFTTTPGTLIEGTKTSSLILTPTNKYVAVDKSNGTTINIKYKGADVTTTSYADWSIVGAEMNTGGTDVEVIWKNSVTNKFWYNTNGTVGQYVNPIAYETQFNQDFNGDGTNCSGQHGCQ